MDMLYNITHLYPRPQLMGGCGFTIQVFPAMQEAVERSGITQQDVNSWLEQHRDYLLIAHKYDPNSYVRLDVNWGEWGPHNVSVPGNACGLDIDQYSNSGAPPGGRVLLPHNVDSIYQANLILCVYTGIMQKVIASEFLRATEGQDRSPVNLDRMDKLVRSLKGNVFTMGEGDTHNTQAVGRLIARQCDELKKEALKA